MSNEVRRARVTFFKGDIKVNKGDLVRVGHEVLEGAEELFEKIGVTFDTPKDEPKSAQDAKPLPPAAPKAVEAPKPPAPAPKAAS